MKLVLSFVILAISLILAPSSAFYGGNLQNPFSLPYIVVLKNPSAEINTYCTGSLISYNYVLTAANCTYKSGYNLEVLAGVYNLSDTQEPTIVYRSVKTIITHPRWNYTTGANDIGLIELSAPMPRYTYIQPIELGDSNYIAANLLKKTGFSAGFGISFNENAHVGYGDTISRIDTPFIKNEECLEKFARYNKTFNENIFCSDRLRGNICLGDFGSPLVYQNKLIGVATCGGYWRWCGNVVPNVFTEIATHLEWIQDNSDVN